MYEKTKTTVTHPVEKVCPPPLRITNGDWAVFCFSMRSAAVLSGVSPEFIFWSACEKEIRKKNKKCVPGQIITEHERSCYNNKKLSSKTFPTLNLGHAQSTEAMYTRTHCTGRIWKKKGSLWTRIACFPLTLRRRNLKTGLITSHFGFAFQENSVREITWFL